MESNSHSSANNGPGNNSSTPSTGSHSNKETNNNSKDSGNYSNQTQTISSPVTVHRPQSQQCDHRTVPTREVLEVEEPKPVKPPVAPKPAFCNSHNCRLLPANRSVQASQEYTRRGSKSNPNLLSSSSDYPDSYYKSMGHAHNLHHYHYNADNVSKTPACQDDLQIRESSDNINIKSNSHRNSHYHSDPDLSGSPDNVVAIDNRTFLNRKYSGDQLLSPVVSVSKASTPDPSIAKGRVSMSFSYLAERHFEVNHKMSRQQCILF